MDRDRALIATGAVGASLVALRCATPLFVFVFGTLGLTAWVARADYIVLPALAICFGLLMLGGMQRQRRQW